MEDQVYTATGAERHLGMKRERTYRWRYRGRLDPVGRTEQGWPLFRESDLRRLNQLADEHPAAVL